MSTTTLYAELIVVGSGALMSIGLWYYSLFGTPPWVDDLAKLELSGSVLFLIPILSVIYLLGIVIANMGDLLFEPFERRLHQNKFGDHKNKYEHIRIAIYTSANTKELIEDVEFRRSKIRICRGWVIDSVLIVVALLSMRAEKMGDSVAWFWITCAVCVIVGAGVSWWNITKTELKWFGSFDEIKDDNSCSELVV